jgi:tetratricopeptide (TPR) repeat protein
LPFLSALLLSCATPRYGEDPSDYRIVIGELVSRLMQNPEDAEALRDMGIIHFQTGRYEEARTYLIKATTLRPDDSRALFYYGALLESLNEKNAALNVYLSYLDLPDSRYAELMQGRYLTLTREVVLEQLQKRIVSEQELGDSEMSRNTVAVFPLEFAGGDSLYRSVGFGLAELMTLDLEKVDELQLVERLRIDALLEELRFGQSTRVDPATAPRIGRLLTAGRVVGGVYGVTEDVVRVDVTSVDALSRGSAPSRRAEDVLENLFLFEKELVLGILEDMGIVLTAAERAAIESVPTKNLQAFLVYCLGLEKEREKDFGGAEVYFNRATEIDPGFTLAGEKAKSMRALVAGGGSLNGALTSAYRMDPPILPDDREVMDSRLGNLGRSIRLGFYPGRDNRKPFQEAAEGGAAVIDLPGPPPPPDR